MYFIANLPQAYRRHFTDVLLLLLHHLLLLIIVSSVTFLFAFCKERKKICQTKYSSTLSFCLTFLNTLLLLLLFLCLLPWVPPVYLVIRGQRRQHFLSLQEAGSVDFQCISLSKLCFCSTGILITARHASGTLLVLEMHLCITCLQTMTSYMIRPDGFHGKPPGKQLSSSLFDLRVSSQVRA